MLSEVHTMFTEGPAMLLESYHALRCLCRSALSAVVTNNLSEGPIMCSEGPAVLIAHRGPYHALIGPYHAFRGPLPCSQWSIPCSQRTLPCC